MQFSRLACVIGAASLLSVHGISRAQSAPPGKPPTVETLPQTIPIFPLEVTMLFPGVSRPLHIFEPRYRAMVADALKGDRIIGMATLKPGYEANYQGRPPVYDVGCAGLITDVEELPGGRFNIVLHGIAKFRMTGEDESRAYRLARVDAMPEVLGDEERTALHKLRLRLEELITQGGDSKVPPDTSDEELVNMVAQYIPIGLAERQGLLELKSALPRARALIELIEAKTTRPRLSVLRFSESPQRHPALTTPRLP
jgi:Lon protease-like protein